MGKKLLNEKVLEINLETVLRLRTRPLKMSALHVIGGKLGLSKSQLAAIADMSIRTLATKSKSSVLSVNASEKIIQLNSLFELGTKVFEGNLGAFINWLNNKLPAMKNRPPSDMLTTHLGIILVKDELLRNEFSIY